LAFVWNRSEALSEARTGRGIPDSSSGHIFSQKIGQERKPNCWLSSGIEVKRYELTLSGFYFNPEILMSDSALSCFFVLIASLGPLLSQVWEPIDEKVKVEEIVSCRSPQPIQRRVAFDIGSGQIKMQVSDVDPTANKIVNVLLTFLLTEWKNFLMSFQILFLLTD